jgi:hypothetical protein
MGVFSLGLGYGFGEDVEPGPFVLSGKYWADVWEVGAEVYFSGDDADEFDQIGTGWLAYRYDVDVEDEGATYLGIGIAGLFEDYTGFENSFGPVGLVGWDSEIWGLELKYQWFDPGIFSFVAYYHLGDE